MLIGFWLFYAFRWLFFQGSSICHTHVTKNEDDKCHFLQQFLTVTKQCQGELMFSSSDDCSKVDNDWFNSPFRWTGIPVVHYTLCYHRNGKKCTSAAAHEHRDWISLTLPFRSNGSQSTLNCLRFLSSSIWREVTEQQRLQSPERAVHSS